MLMRRTRGFRLKANNQIIQICLIDNIKNMVGIKLYFTTLTESESKIKIQQKTKPRSMAQAIDKSLLYKLLGLKLRFGISNRGEG